LLGGLLGRLLGSDGGSASFLYRVSRGIFLTTLRRYCVGLSLTL
jgi:hypothetical protein